MNDSELRTCTNCGCLIEPNDDFFDHDGECYCNDCFCDLFTTCEDCGCIIPWDDVTGINDNSYYVCNDCLEHYTRCDHCGDYYDSRRIWASDHCRSICNYCSGEYYICSNCGDIVHQDNAFYGDDDDEGVYCCADCVPESFIHSYSYKPDWEELRTDDDTEQSRLYGVELEIDQGNEPNECAKELLSVSGDIILKHDGSLGSNGIEIVTQPCTLLYHMNDLQWNEITSTAKNHDYTSHDARTCGLHIHIGRAELSPDTPDKLIVLTDRLWDHLVKFSRREERQLNDWARKPDAEVTANDTPDELQDKLRKVKNKGRYQAVNLRNYSTVEIRIFRGTLKTNTILATLQLVDCLCEYCERHTFTECATAKLGDVIAYSNAPELRTYLQERGM